MRRRTRGRNDKMALIIPMSIAALGLSVGFAAFSRNLTISSSAGVNPNSSDFNVQLSGSSTSNTTSVTPTLSTTGVTNFTGGNATISSDGLTVSNLKANFTEPGQTVTYQLYARNTGKYIAYRTALALEKITDQTVNKLCTAGTDTDATMVTNACSGIKVYVTYGSNSKVDLTNSTYSYSDTAGIPVGSYTSLVIAIAYDSSASRADGPFTVTFGDLKLEYSTVALKLISFSIEGSTVGTYSAEDGMTFREWTASPYNTDGCYIENNGFFTANGTAIYSISVDSVIVNNKSYGTCCFDPGTQVLMADGKTKNIEDIQVGDIVKSLNEDTGEYIDQKVIKTITKHNSDDLVYVHLSNGLRIGMRAYHPLLTTEGYKSLRPEIAKKDVKDVMLLEVGDTLVGYEENVTIISIEEREPIANYDTYNLSIEGYHNYIVEGVVAHNASCKS